MISSTTVKNSKIKGREIYYQRVCCRWKE